MTTQLLGFVGACLAIIIVPGPDLALLLRNATAERHAMTATAAGIMTGNAILATAAVAGLTALFQNSQMLYNAVRLAGAAYLIYLGLQSLIALTRRNDAPQRHDNHPNPPRVHARRRAFRQGLLSNLLNPKVAAFYLALFPQFSLPGLPTVVQHSILAAVFCTLALAWYAVVLVLLAHIRAWLYKHRVQQAIAGASGATL